MNLLYQGPDFKTLHEQYAKKGLLDAKAQVRSNAHIDINTPVSKVWSVLYDIARWPMSHPDFEKISTPSGVVENGEFSFTLKKFPIKAVFATVIPQKELCWTGKSLWTKAIDRMRLEATSDVTTRLYIEESLGGALVPLFMSSKQLAVQHEAWLKAIKKESEQ